MGCEISVVSMTFMGKISTIMLPHVEIFGSKARRQSELSAKACPLVKLKFHRSEALRWRMVQQLSAQEL
jgi:hypothetical protein